MASKEDFDKAVGQLLEEVRNTNKRLDSELVKEMALKLGTFVDESTQTISGLNFDADSKDLKKGLGEVLTNFEIFGQLAEDTVAQLAVLKLDNEAVAAEQAKVKEADLKLKTIAALFDQLEKTKAELAEKQAELKKTEESGVTESTLESMKSKLVDLVSQVEKAKVEKENRTISSSKYFSIIKA